MLDLRVEGDTHPKQFFLVTDDRDAELARLEELTEEVDAVDERGWLEAHTAEQFAEGVEIPHDWLADFIELLEGDWPHAYYKFEKERRAAFEEAEEALAEEDDDE